MLHVAKHFLSWLLCMCLYMDTYAVYIFICMFMCVFKLFKPNYWDHWVDAQEKLLCAQKPCFVNNKKLKHNSVGKESACSARGPSSIPGSGRSTEEGIDYSLQCSWASLVAQQVKNSPAMWEAWVRSLAWEDPLEKGKATTPTFWPREFHGLCSPWGRKELDTTEWLSLSKHNKKGDIVLKTYGWQMSTWKDAQHH